MSLGLRLPACLGGQSFALLYPKIQVRKSWKGKFGYSWDNTLEFCLYSLQLFEHCLIKIVINANSQLVVQVAKLKQDQWILPKGVNAQ